MESAGVLIARLLKLTEPRSPSADAEERIKNGTECFLELLPSIKPFFQHLKQAVALFTIETATVLSCTFLKTEHHHIPAMHLPLPLLVPTPNLPPDSPTPPPATHTHTLLFLS